jgi:NADPH-dependent ferric siderophore reductase
MEIQKKQLKRMIEIKDQQDLNYKNIIHSLLKYEDNNVEYYSESDLTKRTLTHPSAGDMKERMDTTHKAWRNPYKDAYLWIKGELLDIKGINDALLGREQVVKQQSSTESKKRSD